jgi:hypothetical protein
LGEELISSGRCHGTFLKKGDYLPANDRREAFEEIANGFFGFEYPLRPPVSEQISMMWVPTPNLAS